MRRTKGAWKGRKEYIFSFYGLIDFCDSSILLTIIISRPDLRFARVFRLLRIFKLSRYNSALKILEGCGCRARVILLSLFLIINCMSSFSSLFYIVEGLQQPDVLGSIPLAMKWFIMTIVGGGEMSIRLLH